MAITRQREGRFDVDVKGQAKRRGKRDPETVSAKQVCHPLCGNESVNEIPDERIGRKHLEQLPARGQGHL